MKFDAKIVNLLGLVLVLAILGLGSINLVMPAYSGVQSIQEDIATTEQINETYRMRLIELADAESRIAEIEAKVAELREKIPADRSDHSALSVIENASLASGGAYLFEHQLSEVSGFSPRTGDQNAEIPLDGPPPPPPAPPGEGEVAVPVPDAASVDPRKQVEINLKLSVENEEMATAFLDGLRSGPRSLLVTSVQFDQTQSANILTGWNGQLEVQLLMFLYESGEK